jgi:cytochrome P450
VAFVARDATRPECLGKREVKPGSVIFMAPWLLHRNKTLWDRPDEFCPSRFATEEGKASAKSAFLPFSMGARVCPGAAFALQEGVMMLALVVRRFALEPAPRPDPVPFAKMTLNSANGIHIVMRGRPQGGRSPTHDSGAV